MGILKKSTKPNVPDSHEDLLEKSGFAHLATLGSDGSPQSTPMWYAWDGQNLLFSTFKGRQKHRNLIRDPRVAVSITDPDNPYRYMQVQGIATIEDAADDGLISALVQKYVGEAASPWDEPGSERVVVRVEIERTSCFG